MSERLFSCPISLFGFLLVLLFSTAATAAEDFSTSSSEWNGLADFLGLAIEHSAEVREESTLRWQEVSADDVIVVIDPQIELDVSSFARFVVEGGRLLLADDFGASTSLLERLSLTRTEPAPEDLPHRHFVDDHRGWPIFETRGRHPLLEDVREVVANYPAVLYNVGGPVIAYDEEGGLVYDMMLGEGRAVVVADPAVFMNSMLFIADNRQFTRNAFDYLCADVVDCRVWLLIGEVESQGSFGALTTTGPLDVSERIDSLNEGLREAFLRLPQSGLLYFLAIFLVLGSAAYLATVFPWRRSLRFSRYLSRVTQELSPPLTEFDWNVTRFRREKSKINYALPAAILKESFEEVFFGGLEGKKARQQDRDLKTTVLRFEEKYLSGLSGEERERRRQTVERLLRELDQIPGRHRVFLGGEPRYRLRDVKRLRNELCQILEWMELQEIYERRTREIDARGGRRSR